MYDFYGAVLFIVSEEKEYEAIKILLENLNKRCKNDYDSLCECRASLRVIRAINRGKNKAIENLCCEEGETK